ncbi:hypothetical protein H7F51_00890 [Novosphingobium flavum]|uniref:Uncharacterized protein n=1 Tax=Novosphingobium flavum TaxID=1778672 RepID=A0A7X1FNM3_9SPHN|nr:hypothetical protein [Novosphingobium flavum]MBC2664066.1 hypothetical protein [Novosphingobium flavum]
MMTREDRRKELAVLVGEMRDHPSADHTEMRERAWVLSRMMGRMMGGQAHR